MATIPDRALTNQRPPSLAQLSAEVMADVLEYLSTKPVILFLTVRGISRLFHQGVALSFERYYFRKPTKRPKFMDWSRFLSLYGGFGEDSIQLSFSLTTPRVFRSFLTILPWMNDACLQSVEKLLVPFSLSEEHFRTLAHGLPSVKIIELSGGGGRQFTQKTADVVLREFPLGTTLGIRGCIDPNARDDLLTKFLEKPNCRLRMVAEDDLIEFLDPDPVSLDSLQPHAKLFGNLTWLHLQGVNLGELDLFPYCVNLEVLALANLTLRESFFRAWKFCESGYQRKSLRSLDLYNIAFVDADLSLKFPDQTDIEEFFSLNSELTCLSLNLGDEFPALWPAPVAKHCPRLEFLDFADTGISVAELEALATVLVHLECVKVELRTTDLLPERIAIVARFEKLQSLHLRASGESAFLSLEPPLQFLSLERLQISSWDALDSVSCRILCPPELRVITLCRWSQTLLNTIATNCPLLEELTVKGCGETMNSMPDLTSVFQRCRYLKRLTVSTLKFHGSKLLDDVITHRVELSSLTLGSSFGPSNSTVSKSNLTRFLRNIPRSIASLSLPLDGDKAETALRELSQLEELDLRYVYFGSHMDVTRCLSRWKGHLKAIFPNLTLR